MKIRTRDVRFSWRGPSAKPCKGPATGPQQRGTTSAMAPPYDSPFGPEDLDDDAVRRAFRERMIQGAQELHEQERFRLIADGVVDSQGRLLKMRAAARRTTDDGGGW